MPAVLVECGFMDNINDARLLLSDAYRQECADELAMGICEFHGVQWISCSEFTITDAVKFIDSKINIDESLWSGADNESKVKHIDALLIKIAKTWKEGA
jgi:hypothetical protein